MGTLHVVPYVYNLKLKEGEFEYIGPSNGHGLETWQDVVDDYEKTILAVNNSGRSELTRMTVAERQSFVESMKGSHKIFDETSFPFKPNNTPTEDVVTACKELEKLEPGTFTEEELQVIQADEPNLADIRNILEGGVANREFCALQPDQEDVKPINRPAVQLILNVAENNYDYDSLNQRKTAKENLAIAVCKDSRMMDYYLPTGNDHDHDNPNGDVNGNTNDAPAHETSSSKGLKDMKTEVVEQAQVLQVSAVETAENQVDAEEQAVPQVNNQVERELHIAFTGDRLLDTKACVKLIDPTLFTEEDKETLSQEDVTLDTMLYVLDNASYKTYEAGKENTILEGVKHFGDCSATEEALAKERLLKAVGAELGVENVGTFVKERTNAVPQQQAHQAQPPQQQPVTVRENNRDNAYDIDT
ncbi:UNVERIFIED_CONTAM: hypothetical protein HDU68_008264 [Siphonaria sp. JEL0065]|nr:hypothetical protein HDU68_008264 [Siphonaria sp. JEL0065]